LRTARDAAITRGDMTILDHEFSDISTPSGPMRTHIFRPAAPGKYPGVMLFSEIFQVTGPIRRTAAMLAGHGFVVAAPEIFHEFEAPGTTIGYDSAGADRGNWCKVNKPLKQYDDDLTALREWLKKYPSCTGKLGSVGICIGGHMNFRNCMSPDVLAGVCFYATDIHKLEDHKRGLGVGMADDSLERARRGDIKAELLMVWGRQDPHIPFEARMQIRRALEEGGANHQTLEVNGAHAFMRDEGPRYNPALARQCYGLAIELLKRKLGEGDLPAEAGATETKH
jgi:carboxymethylenebutenolidase